MPSAAEQPRDAIRTTPTNAPKPRRWVLPVVVICCLAPILFLAWRSAIYDHYIVPTGSMEPTIHVQDRLYASKSAYGIRVPFSNTWLTHFAGPVLGDVVVYRSPEGEITSVKRVLGVPGDTVQMREGRVTIDGEAMPVDGDVEDLRGKRHSISLANGGGADWGPRKIPADSYFLVGDNRGNSKDSRYIGLIARDAILGQVTKIIHSDGSTSTE
jgi:signal peptidase I